MNAVSTPRGYRAPVVARIAQVTYRQVDYWANTGLVEPSLQDAAGPGSQRLYSLDDVVTLKLIRRLLDLGVSLQRIRHVIDHIRAQGWPLRGLTLASDGDVVYRIAEGQDLVALLQRGRGLFTIAVDPIYADAEARLARLPSEPVMA